MGPFSAIVFDCDGVMFESRAANLAFYNKILNHFSYPEVLPDQEERVHFCHTASTPNVLKGLFNSEHLPRALDYASRVDYGEFIPFMTPAKNLVEVLSELAESYPIAIATNRGASIAQILQHFNLSRFFSAIVNCHDVERPKPAPDMLLMAAEKLDVAPEKCLFLGDSELDRKAAESAGMQFVGYGELSGAKVKIRDHLELLSLLA